MSLDASIRSSIVLNGPRAASRAANRVAAQQLKIFDSSNVKDIAIGAVVPGTNRYLWKIVLRI